MRPAQAVEVNSTASLSKRRNHLLFGVAIHDDAPGAWPVHRSRPLRGCRNIVQLIFSGDCPGGVFLYLSVGRSASDMPPEYKGMRWSCRSAVPLAVWLPRRWHRLAIRCRSGRSYGAIHDGTAAGVLAFPSVPTIRDHRALSVGGFFGRARSPAGSWRHTALRESSSPVTASWHFEDTMIG